MKSKVSIVLMILLCLILLPGGSCFAEDKDIEKQLKEEVNNQLDKIDFDKLDSLFESGELTITDEESFKSIVENLIDGKYNINASSILTRVINLFLGDVSSILPIIIMILAIAILGNIVNSFQPDSNSKAISDLIHFVCVAVVIVLIVAIVKKTYIMTSDVVMKLSNQMAILFPVLMSLMSITGSVVSVGIYQPLVAVLTNGVGIIFSKVIYPIFLLSFIFVILNSLSSRVKLNKFNSFLGSCFKWIVGFVFTLFAGFLTIQGISAGRYDTISLKATRFAMKSYIPIIGGYLSDGLDYILLSGLLIKNAIGVAGLILLISTILVPIVYILVLKLGLQFVAGVIEPVGDSKISGLCDDLSKILVYPIVVILALSFMFLLAVGLIMCTASGL